MHKSLAWGMVVGVTVAITLFFSLGRRSEAGKSDGPMIAHMVYFSLKDSSPKAKSELVQACKKHLSKHGGEVFFGAGTLAEEFDRPVNDRDFDVALHIVFADRKAHDEYQVHPRHNKFIEENKENWKKVRVFDSAVSR